MKPNVPENQSNPETLIGVMIEDCWVLDWKIGPGSLSVECELSLWPGSPNYEEPKENEWACYKPAKILLEGIADLSELVPIESAMKSAGPDGKVDYGSLDSVVIRGNEITLYGPFGNAKVSLKGFSVKYRDPI